MPEMAQRVISDLLSAVMSTIAARRAFPESTYRLQFHAGFTFRDALQIVPYLHELGITHCYASPFLQAQPGSTHGYDITNHQAFNPEIGTDKDYEALCRALQHKGMGQVLDIVPNHMGVAGNENQWWRDVLENGPASTYAGFFDIAWYASPRVEMHEKVLLPVLGKSYGEVLEGREIRLAYAGGAFTVHYFDHHFPVAPRSYAMILEHRHDELVSKLEKDVDSLAEYDSILTAIRHLPLRSETEPAKVAERRREKQVIKRRLAALTDAQPIVREWVEENVRLFNGAPDQPAGVDLLDALLQSQAYRLCYWRVSSEEINYRRFFDINDLAALSMEKPEVFRETHRLILRLLGEGKVHGLRIDHPDGLYNPQEYLRRLQQQYVLAVARRLIDTDPAYRESAEDLETVFGTESAQADAQQIDAQRKPLYVLVEKILGVHEALREDWPVYGTSGYDFLNLLNGLFVDDRKRETFTRAYQEWTHNRRTFADVVYESKRLIMQVSLSSEVHMLAYQLDCLAQKHRRSRDFTFNSLRHALQEVIACFPVYRSYIVTEDLHPEDRRYVQQAVARAQRKNPAVSRELFAFVRDMLLLQYPASVGEKDRAEQRRFVGKFQQVTSPVMAKGLEDTAFYVYTRLLSLNEVGNDADRFGVSPEDLHRSFQERQKTWPWALSTLSTHDTKRSEDVRARLNALSELPEEWRTNLTRWSDLNDRFRQTVDDEPVPDANEEYLLYQTLLGAWPVEPYTGEDFTAFVERLQAYMLKALREAKVHTSWNNPNTAYDEAVQRYVADIVHEEANGAFLDDFLHFQRRISRYGLFNSLSQTLLKITAPGVPDTYQGTEIWDFSLVDPDNRRPVDYARRQRLLEDVQAGLAVTESNRLARAQEFLRTLEDGRIKLYVTSLALHCRRLYPGLFATGDYVPAQAGGARREHVFGFSRRLGDREAIVAVPRLIAGLLQNRHEAPLGEPVWHDTTFQVPGVNPRRSWRNVCTGEPVKFVADHHQPSLAVAEIFAHFPVALLIAE